MQIADERTADEKGSLKWLVIGTDPFLSGWGKAEGGVSYAAWACSHENLDIVEQWVRNRGDMKRVRVVCGEYRPKGKRGHLHIYAVRIGHPALGGRI